MQSPKKAKPVDAPAAEAPLVVPVQPHASVGAHVQGLPAYQKLQREAMADPRKFWAKQARSVLTWDRDFSSTTTGSFEHGDLTWFSGGKLNASVQCLDRHVWNPATADCTALIWEADEIGEGRKYTFREALRAVCRIANVMKAQGVRKGDAVTLYMPMVPESVFVMLACARLGAPHSVVFAGFSAEALRDRIVDVQSRFVFVCDEGMRGGRSIALKRTVDEALADARCAFVQRVFMFKRTGAAVGFNPARDLWMEPLVAAAAPFCPAESVDAEDTLFFLYTSGSTGKPKGIVHTTAGYLLFAAYTHKLVFDVRPDDVYACVADVGWITGHTYIVYGPLANGVSTLVFESTPMHPNVSR
jgi:acetyl-CoA synthetase